jgi:hypothetical protein
VVKHDIRDKNKGATVCYTAFGHNAGSRWNYSEMSANFNIAVLSDMSFTHPPEFSEDKLIFSCEVAVTKEDQIVKLGAAITELADITFGIDGYLENQGRLDALKAATPKAKQHMLQYAQSANRDSDKALYSNLKVIKLYTSDLKSEDINQLLLVGELSASMIQNILKDFGSQVDFNYRGSLLSGSPQNYSVLEKIAKYANWEAIAEIITKYNCNIDTMYEF